MGILVPSMVMGAEESSPAGGDGVESDAASDRTASESSLLPGRERRQERRREASEEYPELSLKLENPLARILVLPLRFEFEKGEGVNRGGDSFAVRIAPRLPFVINEHWHILSQSNISWISRRSSTGTSTEEGLTDLAQTFFFSPDRSIGWDLYWGIGPTFVIPTATDAALGSELLSAGPSVGVFRQIRPWTAGVILNHLNSVAGPSSASSVNLSSVRPLLAYTSELSTTYSLSAEFNYDWQSHQWSGPLIFSVSQLTRIHRRPVQWGVGFLYHPFSERNAPEWGSFFQVTVPFENPRWGGES